MSSNFTPYADLFWSDDDEWSPLSVHLLSQGTNKGPNNDQITRDWFPIKDTDPRTLSAVNRLIVVFLWSAFMDGITEYKWPAQTILTFLRLILFTVCSSDSLKKFSVWSIVLKYVYYIKEHTQYVLFCSVQNGRFV